MCTFYRGGGTQPQNPYQSLRVILAIFVSPELSSVIVSPELSSVRDYVITHSVRSMCMYVCGILQN